MVFSFESKGCMKLRPDLWNIAFQKKDEETKGFNALTSYIFVCMLFMALAIFYYGLILFTTAILN